MRIVLTIILLALNLFVPIYAVISLVCTSRETNKIIDDIKESEAKTIQYIKLNTYKGE